ncbi:MAG TPA: primosomal protein N', partial [Myxococcaceae bacterium]|nr:primosomal protein N' [Myxococcaceae bacterium]
MSLSPLAAVAVARPVRGEFDYLIPEPLKGRLAPGQRILVPFGRGQALGFYLGPSPRTPPPEMKLRAITRALEETPAIPEELLPLLRFAADHYRYPLGEVLKGALPPGLAEAAPERPVPPERLEVAVVLPGADAAALHRAPAQAAALSYLAAVGGRAPVDEVAHAIPGSRPVLRKLAERGFVRIDSHQVEASVRDGLAQGRPERLTPEQAACVAVLEQALGERTFRPFLLHGVTGSGKTEVYLRVVEEALRRELGSLVLVPEIALTPQLVGRFRSRFGARVAVLHSGLKDRERLRYWRALRDGTLSVAVGVRSAVFAPVPRLGVVIVDEEHDGSFKQEEKLRYQARDLAVVRAKQAGALAVLGSATPSLETLENARRGRYGLLEMRVRVDDRPMPTIERVDLRLERPRLPDAPEEAPILSAPILAAMEEVLDRGQQTILFLNRRGHSTYLVCEVCGASLRCRDCDVCVTHHLSMGRVMCHYCGRVEPLPNACRECGGTLLKLGIGTERVAAEVAARFPEARVARLDRDFATTAEKVTELLAAFARRELDILVGTQMVAKGHDFPGVTLVCVVLADTSLSIPDFRAAERTFQLLTQVAGRAGRGQDAGRVLIQTYNPDADSVRRVVAHDFQGFAEVELQWRQ